MSICPCGGKFNEAHRKAHYGTKIHKLYDNQVKKEQKELLEYNSYRSFADKFYNTSQYQKKKKRETNIIRTMNMTYIDILQTSIKV
jgi:hypothetical protein